MRRLRTLTASVTIAAAAVLIASTAASAQAATSSVPFTACSDAPTFGCAHLTVPLDPTNGVPGTISLAVRRELAQTGTATEAVVALAGGPGQAALPFASDAQQIMSAALATRDPNRDLSRLAGLFLRGLASGSRGRWHEAHSTFGR